MISLARACDRRRVEWVGTVVADGGAVAPELCAEMAAYMPVYAASGVGLEEALPDVQRCPSARAALRRVLDESDLLIAWGVLKLQDLVGSHSKPVVLVSHGSCEWSVWTVRSSEPGATHFVAVSEAARVPFSPTLHDRVTVLPNGIDVERCTPILSRRQVRAAWGFEDRHVLVGYVGRYSPEKNPTAAAEAVACLGGDYRAVYAGTGWQEAEVRRRVAEIAGPHARFVLMDRQIGNILSGLDVFLLASPSEGFSLALAEAWYCRVPVVATRVGAVLELESRHGPLVSPLPINPKQEELARAVQYALSPAYRSEVVPEPSRPSAGLTPQAQWPGDGRTT